MGKERCTWKRNCIINKKVLLCSRLLSESFEKEEEIKKRIKTLMFTTFWFLLIRLKANPDQPRKIFKEKEIEEFLTSIKENGIIQPLIVTKGEEFIT